MRINSVRTGLLALLSVASALPGCKEDIEREGGFTGQKIAVTAHSDGTAGTRTTLDGFQTEWEAGDMIGMFSEQAGASNLAMEASTDGVSSPFGGELFWGNGAHSFYGYYPYGNGSFARTAVPVSLPANQTQTAPGNNAHIGKLDFMVARPLGGIEPGTGIQLMFDHLFTLLEFRVVGTGAISEIEFATGASSRLAFSGATVDISQAKPADGTAYTINYSGSSSPSVTLTLNTPATLTGNEATTPALYMMVSPANLSGGRIKVIVTIDGEQKTISANGFNLARGSKYTLVIDSDNGETDPEEDVLELLPDPLFFAYCQNSMRNETVVLGQTQPAWDTDGNGKLSFTEVEAVLYMDCSNEPNYGGEKIASLEGIEYFTGLKVLQCSYQQLTGLDVSKNTELTYLDCSNNSLTSLDVSNNTSLKELSCGDNAITSLVVSNNSDLTRLICRNNRLPSFNISLNEALTAFDCSGNPGSSGLKFQVRAQFDNSSVPKNFTTGTWNYSGRTITIDYYRGNTPPNPNYYVSTDYSADGRVTMLQQASVGSGIDVVLMGDAYSDRLIANGTYETSMRNSMEHFFTEEPYKSHRHLFNVYSVDVVSKNELIANDSSTALGCILASNSTLISSKNNHRGPLNYTNEAISDNRVNAAVVIVMVNSATWHGTCHMYHTYGSNNDWGDGLSISYFSLGENSAQLRQLLNHEANGHGFAKLDDEYWYDNSGTMSAVESIGFREESSWGWWKNTDIVSDPAQVKWAKFLDDSRYAGQGLGVYQGGHVKRYGVWRPTDNSMMRYNTGGFNAPSREAIYIRMHKLAYGADWVYNYEEFVAWDLAHRQASTAKQAAGADEVLKPVPHTPPVIIPHSWRESLY